MPIDPATFPSGPAADRAVLAIDLGTESLRAAVVDAAGRFLGMGRSPITTEYPAPGRAEQDPDEWDSAMGNAVRTAIRESGLKAEDIRGVAADGTTSTVICLDKAGRPLRKALLWSDIRAVEEAAILGSTGDPVLSRAGGGNPSAEWFPCKALWIKRHEPEIWNASSTILCLSDWLAWRLCGEFSLNLNTATMRGFYDSRRGGIPSGLYRAAGLEGLIEKLPSRAARPGQAVGSISERASELTGLPRGIPVAAGGGDAFIGTIGLNALRPGRVAMITGSSHVITAHVDAPIEAAGLFGSFPDALYEKSHLLEGGLASSGSVVRWFTQNFIGRSVAEAAEASGLSLLAYLDGLARGLPPGSDGLMVLEHWQGSRCPWVDSDSRGAIRGLTLLHRPEHVYRAIMEGVAFGTALILDRMETAGVPVEELRVCGGPSKSELWMRIHADVTGKPIVLPREPESVLLGSAILATLGAGLYRSLDEAAEAMSGTSGLVLPDPGRHAIYRKLLARYEATYEALKPLTRAEAKEPRP